MHLDMCHTPAAVFDALQPRGSRDAICRQLARIVNKVRLLAWFRN
jgi:hypothetical protein